MPQKIAFTNNNEVIIILNILCILRIYYREFTAKNNYILQAIQQEIPVNKAIINELETITCL